MNEIIVKVREDKTTGQKLITVPKKCSIKNKDLVKLVKVKIVEEKRRDLK